MGLLEIQTEIAAIKRNKSVHTEELCASFSILLTEGVWALGHKKAPSPAVSAPRLMHPQDILWPQRGALEALGRSLGAGPHVSQAQTYSPPNAPAPASTWYLKKTRCNENSIP